MGDPALPLGGGGGGDVADPFSVAPALPPRARNADGRDGAVHARPPRGRAQRAVADGGHVDRPRHRLRSVQRFGNEVLVAKAAPTTLHPKPGLCSIGAAAVALDLTVAEASLHGLTALAFQRNASRYATHLSELQALLTTIGTALAPISCRSRAPSGTSSSLGLPQPSRPTTGVRSGRFVGDAIGRRARGTACAASSCAPNSRRPSNGVRSGRTWTARSTQSTRTSCARSQLRVARGAAGRRRARHRAAGGGRAGVLDISKMMNCTLRLGKCGRESGWTRDGLHLGLGSHHQIRYFAVSANVLADFGAARAPTSWTGEAGTSFAHPGHTPSTADEAGYSCAMTTSRTWRWQQRRKSSLLGTQ